MVSLNYNDKTNIMLTLIIINITVYTFIYFVLQKKLKPVQSLTKK